ncbi:hypothetical protein J7T55_007327 [Diaporthe amygdali]|uniref:uncharacterized protein n=1 Tax=Phomopsis amygdali TaxID=1214568 RepID=UPI0022FEB7A4|nr:uncharacterized protein J7T55_007327 [Diaporthe amygdali]KAJ0116348.1 hypothetical protein J7T55_007327 [Diaporthe amygdali]
MDSNSDQASQGPDPDDQKVRVQSGTTGAKMAAEKPPHNPSERGVPASDTNNSPVDDRRHQINRDEFSGLQVVESGLEVPHSALPEALPPSDPETAYAEYKGWGDNSSPPQVLHAGGGGSWPFPEAVSPGGDNAYTPVSQPYSEFSKANYHGGHNPFDPPDAEKQRAAERRICGLRRMIFWCVLAVAVFVVVVGVAVGVGVGLGTRNDSSSSNSTSTSTSSHSVPSATATAAATTATSIVCPMANRTTYTLESSSKQFLVLCGRDYNSCCGAVDMLTVNTTTFEACLEQCSAQEGCTAVGWGNYYGTNTCWLKSAWGEPNWSGSWYAAIEVDSGG